MRLWTFFHVEHWFLGHSVLWQTLPILGPFCCIITINMSHNISHCLISFLLYFIQFNYLPGLCYLNEECLSSQFRSQCIFSKNSFNIIFVTIGLDWFNSLLIFLKVFKKILKLFILSDLIYVNTHILSSLFISAHWCGFLFLAEYLSKPPRWRR